jgi:tellurite resistance protein
MSQPQDMVAVMASVMGAMESGEITPDEAKAVAEVVELQRRAIETQDLEQRIAALERSKA